MKGLLEEGYEVYEVPYRLGVALLAIKVSRLDA